MVKDSAVPCSHDSIDLHGRGRGRFGRETSRKYLRTRCCFGSKVHCARRSWQKKEIRSISSCLISPHSLPHELKCHHLSQVP